MKCLSGWKMEGCSDRHVHRISTGLDGGERSAEWERSSVATREPALVGMVRVSRMTMAALIETRRETECHGSAGRTA